MLRRIKWKEIEGSSAADDDDDDEVFWVLAADQSRSAQQEAWREQEPSLVLPGLSILIVVVACSRRQLRMDIAASGFLGDFLRDSAGRCGRAVSGVPAE